MSIDLYRERVAALAIRRNGEPVYNGSLEHAAVLVENMFQHAQDRVCILSGSLNARVYGPEPVIQQARLFLADPKHSLKILVEDEDDDLLKDHPFIEEFASADNVELRRVPKSMQNAYKFHFLAMDGDSYRFEGDRTKHAAIAAFGDKEGAQNLEKVFEMLWDVGAPVDLPKVAAN